MSFIGDLNYMKTLGVSFLETLRVSINARFTDDRFICNLNGDPVSVFFIFSLGRSGTQFLSRILNSESNADVIHEPLVRDFIEYANSFGYSYDYEKYTKFRVKFIRSYVKNKNIKVYGEVNSILRRHARVILENIENVKGFYLIRDGRDVVRSMMSRGAMSNNWFYNKIIPKESDPYFDVWSDMNQFEKCCWVWASENKLLFEQFGPALQFENILSDYEYFKSKLLDPLCLNISHETWKKEKLVKSDNHTQRFTCDPYPKWPVKWKDAFWGICGEMMQRNGYEVNKNGS